MIRLLIAYIVGYTLSRIRRAVTGRFTSRRVFRSEGQLIRDTIARLRDVDARVEIPVAGRFQDERGLLLSNPTVVPVGTEPEFTFLTPVGPEELNANYVPEWAKPEIGAK